MRSNVAAVHTDSWKWPFHRKNRTTTTQQQQQEQEQEQEQRCQTPVLVTKKAVAAAVGAVAA